MLRFPQGINDSVLGNIKYRNNVVTGVIAEDNGNYTYDVYIAGEDTAYPNVHTTQKYPEFSTGDSVEILMEYGSKEMPIIIGYAKKIVQEIVEVDMNVIVTTLDAYGTSNSRTYLEGRIEDIEGYENCLLQGFHYGLTTSYGTDNYTTGSFAAGSYALQTTGLSANTTYNFCAYVYDADGDAQTGDNKIFTTTTSAVAYLFSADYGTDVISKHDGISDIILATWGAVGGDSPGGLTNDGTDLIELTEFGVNGKVHIHDGLTSGISSSFNTPGAFPSGAAFDGTNLISCDSITGLIYIHTGITSGVSSSFNSPGGKPMGLTVIGGNLVSCDDQASKIYVHSGITSGVTSTLNPPSPYPLALANDGTNLLSGDYGTTGTDGKIYIHTGVSSGITSSFNIPAGYTKIKGLTYYSG